MRRPVTGSTREPRPPAGGQAPAAPAPGHKARPGPERAPAPPAPPAVREIGGPKGPEPTRYGDWEQGGRCTDF
jgi:hypothetical protein